MKMKHFLLLLVCLLGFYSSQSQNTVYLESGEFGRGILKSRSGESFVIAPFHVVENLMGGQISIYGNKNILSKGELIKSFPGDLAIIRIVGGGTQESTSWKVDANYSSNLDQLLEGFLELRNNDGSADLMPVSILNKDDQNITIEPKKQGETFKKGMSGSSLFANVNGQKMYLGMLLSIDDEDERMGFVFQVDDMERILGGFFETSKPNNASQNTLTKSSSFESNFNAEEEGFRFDLISAKKSGNKVICKIGITSLDQDGTLIIYNTHTKIYDERGFEYAIAQMKMGSQTESRSIGNGRTFISGVQTKIDLIFDDVSEASKGISLLKIQIRPNGRNAEVKLKNISFEGMDAELKIPRIESVKSNEEEGFRFDLISAKKSGTTVKCIIGVTSLDQDGSMILYNTHTKLYDEQGFEIAVAQMKLAAKTETRSVGAGNYTFVKGVQTFIEITFKEVREKSKGISLLKLQIRPNGRNSEVKFKNISYSGFGNKLMLPKTQGMQQAEAEGFSFDLISTKKSGTRVICLIGVTSLNKDGSMILYNTHTKMYDDQGMESQVDQMKLARKTETRSIGTNNYTFVKGVQTMIQLSFKEIEETATGISLLKLQVRPNGRNAEVSFRNIKF